MQRHFLLLTILSLALVGAGCARKTTEGPSVTGEGAVVAPKAAVIEHNSITAEKQAPNEYVNVAGVVLAAPGSVAIHEDAGGKPGDVIGKSQVFKPGVYTVTVSSLNRPTKAGEKLYAMLHGENGTPLKDAKGETAVSALTITK